LPLIRRAGEISNTIARRVECLNDNRVIDTLFFDHLAEEILDAFKQNIAFPLVIPFGMEMFDKVAQRSPQRAKSMSGSPADDAIVQWTKPHGLLPNKSLPRPERPSHGPGRRHGLCSGKKRSATFSTNCVYSCPIPMRPGRRTETTRAFFGKVDTRPLWKMRENKEFQSIVRFSVIKKRSSYFLAQN